MAAYFFLCFFSLVLGSLADVNPKENINLFMDFVLEHRMPNYVKSLNIDPIKISPFMIRLENFRFFKADLGEGIMRGLSTALHRRGDCGRSMWHGANLTSECYLALEGLRVTFNGTARGLDELDSRTEFKLDVEVLDTTVFVELTGLPGQHAMLKDRDIGELDFNIKVDKQFGLNEWRMDQFKEVVTEHLKHSLLRTLYSSFSHALKEAFSSVALPSESQ